MKIGSGILMWNRKERQTDRYGSVMLSKSLSEEDDVSNNNDAPLTQGLEGRRGSLYAIVTESRKSEHRGDIPRGLVPEQPQVGEKITLGTGKLFYEDSSVGLVPDDRRRSDWLDPAGLYRLHSQTVDLYFEPSTKGPSLRDRGAAFLSMLKDKCLIERRREICFYVSEDDSEESRELVEGLNYHVNIYARMNEEDRRIYKQQVTGEGAKILELADELLAQSKR